MVFGNKLFTVQCGYRPTCKTHSCSWLGLYRTSWSWNEDSNPGLLLCTMGLNSLWSRTWIFLYSNDATLSKSPLYLFLQSQQPKLWIQIFPKFLTKFCKSWFSYIGFSLKTIWLKRNPENSGFVLSELVYGLGDKGNGFKSLYF